VQGGAGVVLERQSGCAADAPRDSSRFIRVRGAREHNLKNINVEIPRDRLVVITGLSGSGKSSLAFDTIFAEGQRKYMESLSAYARQFLEQLKKPDVDEVEGVPPTIAIEQRSASSNPRSTVATTTEIYDYLRLLFARCGRPCSWAPIRTKRDGTVLARSGVPISATTSTQIVDAILAATSGRAPPRMMILAPIVRARKGFHRDILEDLASQGWTRVRVNGHLHDLREVLKEPGENPLGLGRYEKHTIEAVVDRLTPTEESRQRLAESVEVALRLSQGVLVISREDGEKWVDRSFSTRFADPDHPEVALDELEPRLFSFNSPQGACPKCSGLGTLLELDEHLVLPNPDKSLREGAVEAYGKNAAVRGWFHRGLRRFCRAFGVPYDAPVASFPANVRKALMHGVAREEARSRGLSKWEGVLPELTAWWQTTENVSVKEWLGRFMSNTPCPECHGDRLRIEALHVLLESTCGVDARSVASGNVIGRPAPDSEGRISESHELHFLNIAEVSRLTIPQALAFLDGLVLSHEEHVIAEPILKEIRNRLRFLSGVGLEYLNLSRKTSTLSGGEAQRIRLASQVGSGLVGACYVLDEPTIGLHQRDNDRLIATLRHLTDIGNTVLVVEHDEEMIRSADHVIDIGPGPGVHGGRVVAQGTIEDVCACPASITGDYLAGRRRIEIPSRRRKLDEKDALIVRGAKENNLKNIDVSVPTGGLVCVTGVSGSGKSTLVADIILRAARRHLYGARERPGAHGLFRWPRKLDRVIEVDQTPIGRTPRSNPATYVGFFDEIRSVFGQTREARIRGYKPGRFSFNVPAQNGGGRCEACQGQGLKTIEMHFLPDVYVECEICKGKRYNRETLEVTYRGRNIADVLSMTVEEALGFFDAHPRIARSLQCLHDVGLDYLQLGQPSTQLSGGEAQRVKLATELAKGGSASGPLPTNGRTLYILDEPTTGLHFEDIRKLIAVFDRLADAGHTLLVIEHNLDVIKCADWVIDLGPEGGDAGGRVVATGTPEQVARCEGSFTGKYLRTVLGQ
jgi:excinuclease ABC subunit A